MTIAAGVSSSKVMPLALMTIRSSPGTRALRLPLVHATSPLRGNSACRSQTMRRSSSTSSVTDELLARGRAPQPVHDVVAVAAEVVVQPAVVLEQLVVAVGSGGVGHV